MDANTIERLSIHLISSFLSSFCHFVLDIALLEEVIWLALDCDGGLETALDRVDTREDTAPVDG